MPAKRKDQVLVNKNFLMILFALIIILIIVNAVLLGVVVSNKRESANTDKQTVKVEGSVDEVTTLPPVSVSAPASGIGNYKVNTQADALNLRALADAEGEILTEIPKGTTISITALNGEWGYTTYNGIGGWVKMSYLAAVDSYASASATAATIG